MLHRVQNIFKDRKDCEKPQTENVAPKTKPDVSSILKVSGWFFFLTKTIKHSQKVNLIWKP